MFLRPVSIALLLVVTTATGAVAQDAPVGCESEEIRDPVSGSVTTIYHCPEDEDGGGGDGDGDRGGDVGGGLTCVQTYWPMPPADDMFTRWLQIDDRGENGVWGHGHFNCSDGSDRNWWACYEFCEGGEPEPDWATRVGEVLAKATARVDPPVPGMHHSFERPAHDGDVRAIVKAETWWWGEAMLDPIVVREEDPPVWVQVTATPGPSTIDPGDGTGEFTCPGLGLAWNYGQSYYDQVPGEPKGACVHMYEETFDSVSATMSIEWTITYEGFAPGLGNVSGTLAPVVREEQVSFPVKEIQSRIVYGRGS